MPFCAAINCSNRLKKGSGKSFHRFPRSNPAMLKEWLLRMKRDCWSPSPYSSLCCDHFEEKCFDRTGQTTRLHADALPTIFNFPDNLEKSNSRRKLSSQRNVIQDTSRGDCGEDSNSATEDKDIISVIPSPCEQPYVTAVTTTAPLVAMAGASTDLCIAPVIPVAPMKTNFRHDHTYHISESPKSVKRKLNRMYDTVASLQKRLKSSQTKSRRLRKKLDSLHSVLKTLKEKNLLSESAMEVVEKTCDMPG